MAVKIISRDEFITWNFELHVPCLVLKLWLHFQIVYNKLLVGKKKEMKYDN